MNEKDDRDWFDLVAGREVPDANPAVRHEAKMVREALLAELSQEEVAADESNVARSERTRRLLDRARAEGLIAGGSPARQGHDKRAGRSPIIDWLLGRRGMVAAAAVLLMAVALVWLQPPSLAPVEDDTNSRGGASQLIVRQTAEPDAAAKALAEALQEAGLKVAVRQASENWYVETNVPDSPSQAVKSALEKADIFNAESGPLRVLFRKSG